MKFELVVRYIGYGLRCDNCNHITDITRYTIRTAEDQQIIEECKLCQKCTEKGSVICFNTDQVELKPERITSKFKRTVKLSRKLERQVAADIGGHTTPGSGNRDTKADIRVFDKWRIEHKYTENAKSYTVKLSDLIKLINYADKALEKPAFIIEFTRASRRFALITYELFLHIVEILHD